jgi:hypothetical protein
MRYDTPADTLYRHTKPKHKTMTALEQLAGTLTLAELSASTGLSIAEIADRTKTKSKSKSTDDRNDFMRLVDIPEAKPAVAKPKKTAVAKPETPMQKAVRAYHKKVTDPLHARLLKRLRKKNAAATAPWLVEALQESLDAVQAALNALERLRCVHKVKNKSGDTAFVLTQRGKNAY